MPIKSGKEKSITQSLSLFDLPRVKFQDLENISKNSFGDLLFEDLEKIRQDSSGEITDKIEAAKNHATELMRLEQLEKKKRRLEKEDPDHVKCEGKPDPKWIMNRKEQLVSRCSKCSRWIPV